MNLELSFIAKSINAKLVGCDMAVTNLVTDSRRATAGCLFAVIKGERTDGMNYVKDLDKTKGIAYLTDREIEGVSNPYILVDNVVEAVGKIARLHLDSCPAKRVAVTGSVGKTTTKNYIAAALSACVKTHYLNGNFNNELGMPLTALATPEDADVTVLEMGMRGFGQITYLCNIAPPDVAVITNIGVSHIELLGSKENILKAKLEIADALTKEGTLVINADDDMLSTVKTDKKTITFGIKNKNADVLAINVVDNKFTLKVDNSEYEVTLSQLGVHNVYNALAAISVGIALGFDINSLIKGVEGFLGDGSRQNIYEYKGCRIFDDTYNASPDSMRAAMRVMQSFDGRRVLVLADMLELGEYSESLHKGLADTVKEIDAKLVVCIGNHMKNLYNALDSDIEKYQCGTNEQALEILKTKTTTGDNILFKGSNSMNLASLVEQFKGGME